MNTGKLYGVGIGPGDPRYLTFRAAEVLRASDVIFTVCTPNAATSISRSVVESLAPLKGEIRNLSFSMSREPGIRASQVEENIAEIRRELLAGRDCAFATLGDAMTYSTFGYILEGLKKDIPGLEVEVVPGITSFATLAAKTATILVENREELRIVPAFRSEMAEEMDFPAGSTTVLMKTFRSRDALMDRLGREDNIELLYGARLGMEGEFFSSDPVEITARSDEYLSLMMVKKR